MECIHRVHVDLVKCLGVIGEKNNKTKKKGVVVNPNLLYLHSEHRQTFSLLKNRFLFFYFNCNNILIADLFLCCREGSSICLQKKKKYLNISF